MTTETQKVRLQKIIAGSGVSSRRKAEEYIRHGLVTVNGETVMTLGTKVDPLHDHIKVNGRHIKSKLPDMFVMLNKPVGYLSTLHDPEGRPTIKQLMTKPSLRLFPVGRLDFDSEGLLLLTNNGDIAQACLHPTHHVQKTYLVKVKGVLEEVHLQHLRRGVSLEDGQTAPAKVKKAGKLQSNSWVEITIHEGRKHQVKRMFEYIGHPVIRLKRIQFGPLNLGKLLPGKTRYLTNDEANDLRHLVEISGSPTKPDGQVKNETTTSSRLPSSNTPSRWAAKKPRPKVRPKARPNPRLASSSSPSRVTTTTSKRTGSNPRVPSSAGPTRSKPSISKLPGPKPRLASSGGPSRAPSHTSKRSGPNPRLASSSSPSRGTTTTRNRTGSNPRVPSSAGPTRSKSSIGKLPGPKPRLASSGGPSRAPSHTSKRSGPNPRTSSSGGPSRSASNKSKYTGKSQSPRPIFPSQPRPRIKRRKRT